jgi:hypothetical protein
MNQPQAITLDNVLPAIPLPIGTIFRSTTWAFLIVRLAIKAPMVTGLVNAAIAI